MVLLVMKLQVATTNSPTVEVISMSVMMPPKETESVPFVLPVVNNSNEASAVSGDLMMSSMRPA